VIETAVTTAVAPSSVSMLAVELAYKGTRGGFDALGEPGKPAETVAGEVVEAALSFDDGTAAVDEHTADQLLVLLALAGGRIPAVTDHVAPSLDLLEAFGFEPALDTSGATPTVSVAE
jgi:RNA 3'-terminal phosphate cyclase (ATP)